MMVFGGMLFAACAHWAGGRVCANPRHRRRPAGARGVIVAGNPWDGAEKSAKVEAVVSEVVGGVKGATVVAAEVRKDNGAMGDRDALLAARTAGAERVCVVTIASYGGMFSIGVARAVGAGTPCSIPCGAGCGGGDLLESVSFCQNGGPWEAVNPTEYEKFAPGVAAAGFKAVDEVTRGGRLPCGGAV